MGNARKTLLLDVMSTLVYDPFMREMPAHFGLSLEELLSQKDPRAWVEFEHGNIEESTFFERFFADRRPVDGPALRAMMRSSYRLLEGIEPLLEDLRAAGVPMHALSNYTPWYHDIEAATGLSRFLEWSFVSCDLGLRKPDPELYQEVVRRLDVAPGACVFVDDREVNVAAARAEGLVGVRFEDAAQLRAALNQLGLL